MSLLLSIWISDVFFKASQPSRLMAERVTCVSAFWRHPFRENETIQACWKEVRQPRGAGGAGDSRPSGGVTRISSAEAVVPVATGKHDDKRAVVAERPDHDPKSASPDWDSSSSSDAEVYHASASSHQRLPTPWISRCTPPPPPPDSRIPTTLTSQPAAWDQVAISLRCGDFLCHLSTRGLLLAATC